MLNLNKRAGFSLIELSIVILIASIFASSMINIMGKKTMVDRNLETKEKLTRIGEALKVYWETNSRHYLPCPAKLDMELNSDKLGAGQGNGGSDCPLYQTLDGINGTKVVVGAVPVIDLGLPPQYMLDAWGNRIEYIVDMNLVMPWDDVVISNISLFDKDYSNGTTPNEDPNFAYVNRLPLQKEMGHSYTPCNGGNNITPNGYSFDDPNNRIPDCPAFLLISHGANGYLAFNSRGTQKTQSFGMTLNERRNTPNGEGDQETGKYDNVSIMAPVNQDTKTNNINGGNYFDDILYYKSMSYFTGVTPPAGRP